MWEGTPASTRTGVGKGAREEMRKFPVVVNALSNNKT